MNLPKISLPKWPGLLVVGKPVTATQAKEINIRTSNLPYLSTNNRIYEKQFCQHFFNRESLYEGDDYVQKN